jgi:hypothetical protein
MQEINKPEDLIGDVLKAITYVFTGCPTIIVKLLTSQKGDRQHLLHTDYVPTDATITMKKPESFPLLSSNQHRTGYQASYW